ncbi:hypothetical protein D9619_003433 [Psilocybe cf. subviscida]|uniref:Uncharacterized protein n=1 Tax=Psilocybe cf. subviscida TaxID=2480587 RepID=A0A8H5AXR2_9AGAR|nr:hypothetical protein D9619_003433 [Psilocybe cf. subviscida]
MSALVNLNTKPSSREERKNSIPRTQQALKDNYGADVTAREDEQDAQAAEIEGDDLKIKDAEDARSDHDSNYQDSQDSQSTDQDSQGSQSSFTSFSSDASYPPFKPKTHKVMTLDDEDEDAARFEPVDKPESESTPRKKNNSSEPTTPKQQARIASAPSGSTTPTTSNAVAEGLPLFLPASPSPEPPSPVPTCRWVEEETDEAQAQFILPSSQELAAGDDGNQDQGKVKKVNRWRSLFGFSSLDSLASDGKQEEPKEGKSGGTAPLARAQPIAQRRPNRAPVLQPLDANRAIGSTIDNAAQDSATAGKNKTRDTGIDKDKDASSSAAPNRDDGSTTPLPRMPTQRISNETARGWQLRYPNSGARRIPPERAPNSKAQGKDKDKGKGKADGNSNRGDKGKAGATSPGAKPRSNKRPAEDPPSPRRSSKAENRSPDVEEKKRKVMRRV